MFRMFLRACQKRAANKGAQVIKRAVKSENWGYKSLEEYSAEEKLAIVKRYTHEKVRAKWSKPPTGFDALYDEDPVFTSLLFNEKFGGFNSSVDQAFHAISRQSTFEHNYGILVPNSRRPIKY
jgi:hypothetical protein